MSTTTTTPADDEIRCLDVPQLVELLNISRARLYVLLQQGDLPSLTIGARRLVTVASVKDYLRSRQQ
ncbi:MAG: helix-turn-helix domain-containing protein [Acidimicrobiales bacterium]